MRPEQTGLPAELAVLDRRERIVTVGTFDGVHRGHRLLIDRAANRSEQCGASLAVVTFEPVPASVLRPDRFPGRICSATEKFRLLRRAPIDEIVPLTFTRDL